MLFGCAEDHDSNPIKTGLAKVKQNGAKFVSVNPVRTGYSAIADEWMGITPGSDGLLVLALVHLLLTTGRIDARLPMLRYTNARLVGGPTMEDGTSTDGLFATRWGRSVVLCCGPEPREASCGLQTDVGSQ